MSASITDMEVAQLLMELKPMPAPVARQTKGREQNAVVQGPYPYIAGFDYEQPIPDPANWTARQKECGCFPVYHYYSSKDPSTHLVVGKYPALSENSFHSGSKADQDNNTHLGMLLLARYGRMTKGRMQNTMEKWSLIKRKEIEADGPNKTAARRRHDNSLRHGLSVKGVFYSLRGECWRLASTKEEMEKNLAVKLGEGKQLTAERHIRDEEEERAALSAAESLLLLWEGAPRANLKRKRGDGEGGMEKRSSRRTCSVRESE